MVRIQTRNHNLLVVGEFEFRKQDDIAVIKDRANVPRDPAAQQRITIGSNDAADVRGQLRAVDGACSAAVMCDNPLHAGAAFNRNIARR
jgi:hypothetical protein